MKKILVLLLAISCLLSANGQQPIANSQQPIANSQDCEILLSKNYLKSYWDSGLTVLGQPLHYDWKDWTVFGGVAAATTLAFVYDDEIYDIVNKNFNDDMGRFISRYTDVFGEEYFILPTVALTYAISAINKDCRLRNLSLATLQSFIYAELASAGLKVLTCRLRPSDSNLQPPTSNFQNWLGPFATLESTSFPSGHAMRSFALATTVAGFYPDKKWLGVVSYSLATMTSIGRVLCEDHWLSDVVVGAALGYFIGRGVVSFNEKIGNITAVEIVPVTTDCGVGVAIKF